MNSGGYLASREAALFFSLRKTYLALFYFQLCIFLYACVSSSYLLIFRAGTEKGSMFFLYSFFFIILLETLNASMHLFVLFFSFCFKDFEGIEWTSHS